MPASQATPLSSSGRPDRGLGSGAPAVARPAGPPTPAQTEITVQTGPATLSLRLHIDFPARKATVAVDDGSDPLELEFDGDAWRPASSSSSSSS